MASITNLSAMAATLTATAPATLPAEAGAVGVTASEDTWRWIAADLQKRRKRLEQCVRDPKTRPNKREKRDRELRMLDAALAAITDKVNIY